MWPMGMREADRETRKRPLASRKLLWIAGMISLCGNLAGCGAGPRHFRAIESPSSIFRARAATLGENLPDRRVIPKLIEHLDDRDPMVRLTANQELLRRTGQDFQFVPWAAPQERAQAVNAWKAWWNSMQSESEPGDQP